MSHNSREWDFKCSYYISETLQRDILEKDEKLKKKIKRFKREIHDLDLIDEGLIKEYKHELKSTVTILSRLAMFYSNYVNNTKPSENQLGWPTLNTDYGKSDK